MTLPETHYTPADDPRVVHASVGPDTTLGDAMRRMDESAERILFVVGPERGLLGVVTDGDVRRWVLAGNSLRDPIALVMNANPRTVGEDDDAVEAARALMVEHRIECVPVVSAVGAVLGAVWWLDLFSDRPKKHGTVDAPVIIMAGGKGTRLSPYTRVLPKPLMPVGDKPVLELIIERFVRHGCHDFHVSLNYKAGLIKAYFADQDPDYDLHWLEEDEPLGTAGCLRMLLGRVTSSMFVSNCDILIDADYADIMRLHHAEGNAITLVASMQRITVPYGVCELREGGALEAIREKPDFDMLVSTGMYVVEPDLLGVIPEGKAYHLTDLIEHVLSSGGRVGVYPISEKAWKDIGQIEELEKAVGEMVLGL